ncbi:NAD-dependent epimerase/dehydratase family protein [Photorhabdus viridis]|uniref:NAD-dependent epimerase/dehydratase family protein n=1 Tax=Photorhabdus viridis TaxID=3163327 RepID=UPI003307857F
MATLKIMNSILRDDLQRLISDNKNLFSSFREQKIFITGGTGFIGKWLLYSFCYANDELRLSCELVVISRNPEKFIQDNPYFKLRQDIYFIESDVVLSHPNKLPKCDYYIHAATDVADPSGATDYLSIMDVNTKGTTNILEAARLVGAKSVLLLSSGAVYGVQPTQLNYFTEEYNGAPSSTDVKSAYGLGKRYSEWLSSLYHSKYSLNVISARCFAFVGPFLPLDKHFAIGNFINDAIHGRDINIDGDGTPLRSYMYATDLVKWLLVLMLNGKSATAYNVGSDQAISIAELAQLVSDVVNPSSKIHIAKTPAPDTPPARYIPSIQKSYQELGLSIDTTLTNAIERTAHWAIEEKK